LIWINPGVRQRTDLGGRLAHILDMARRSFTGMHQQEQVMSTNKDQVEGRVKEAQGKIKQVAGKIVGNEKMEVKGTVQKTLGKAQAKFGDVKQNLKDSK
jgi:uncharacterized protein YjbJ (UPF0337 family)